MNGQALVDLAKSRFSDTGGAIHSDTEWLSYVNAAYRDFVMATRWPALVTEVAATIAANGSSVTIPAAALDAGVVGVFRSTGEALVPVPADLPAKRRRFYVDSPSVPIYWEQVGKRIVVVPASLGGETLSVAYVDAITALDLATSPVIPENYHDALVAGALARAYRDDGNPQLAETYDAEVDRFVKSAIFDADKDGDTE